MSVRACSVVVVVFAAVFGGCAVEDDDKVGSAGCGHGDVAAGDFFVGAVDVDGVARRYAVAVPAGYDDAVAAPVVVVFHGDAECADFDPAENACVTPTEVLGDALRASFGLEDALPGAGVDAVVVYVEGANQNRFRPDLLSWDTFSKDGDNADFAAVDAVLDDVAGRVCADVDDAAAVGFSGGAFFVHALACLHGGLGAVAAFEGGFESGEVAVSYDEGNVVDPADCGALPPALIVQADDDTVVPPRYGEAAAAVYAGSCDADADAASDLDADCVEFCDDTVFCSPASAAPPRTHAIWTRGPGVAAEFFARHL
jgi:poly(3-hydroxybutyrate) depolymerase